MKTIANLLRRALVVFQMRAVEIQIDGMNQCLEAIKDPMLEGRIILARRIARNELARLRSEYNATLPVGQRRTWRLA